MSYDVLQNTAAQFKTMTVTQQVFMNEWRRDISNIVVKGRDWKEVELWEVQNK